MRVAVAMEGSFLRFQGGYHSAHLTYDRFWRRYLDVFDGVTVLARARDCDSVPLGWKRADGPGVTFQSVPHYHGPLQYLKIRREVKRAVALVTDETGAIILRVPGMLGTEVWKHLMRDGRPFAVEVVGDPWLSLAPGTVRSWGRPVFRRFFTWALRRQCQSAVAALYVTQEALQRRYPANRTAYSVGCSDVEIPDSAIVEDLGQRLASTDLLADRLAGRGDSVRLGFIGSFNGFYKAPDIHLKALASCRQKGMNLKLTMVGDGSELNSMKLLAGQLGIGDMVEFSGRLPAGEPIFQFLDSVDLFLNASRQEGLPRALVEAMARGCPAIGTAIAGIPELLPKECLVPAGQVDALANAIQRVLADPANLSKLARMNRDTARGFASSVLVPRRLDFYREVARHDRQVKNK